MLIYYKVENNFELSSDRFLVESPPPSRNSRIGFYEEPRVHEFSDAPDSPVQRRLPVSPLAREAPIRSPLATPTPPPVAPAEPETTSNEAQAEINPSSDGKLIASYKLQFLATDVPTLKENDTTVKNTKDPKEEAVENRVEETNNSIQENTQDTTQEVTENVKTPDLVVEENGKFSVQSSQDEVSKSAEDSQRTQDELKTSTSRAQSATSSWSVTESHTDEYKVCLANLVVILFQIIYLTLIPLVSDEHYQ